MKSTLHRSAASHWLGAALLSLCATASAAELVEASNGSTVGPLFQAPHTEQWFALLDLDAEADPLYGERIFAYRFDVGAVESGYVEVFLGPDGIEHPYSPFVFFSAPACEGQPFVSKSATQLARNQRAAVVGARAALFLATSNVAVLQPIASQLTAAGCRPFRYTIRAFPARAAGDLLDRLPPPYRIGHNG